MRAAPLTAPCVPTGMNAGVSTVAVRRRAARRAAPRRSRGDAKAMRARRQSTISAPASAAALGVIRGLAWLGRHG